MAADVAAAPRARRGSRDVATWLASPPGWVLIATVVSIGVTIWWVASDTRVPSWDPGAHMFRALEYADAFRAGDLTEWFTSYRRRATPRSYTSWAHVRR